MLSLFAGKHVLRKRFRFTYFVDSGVQFFSVVIAKSSASLECVIHVILLYRLDHNSQSVFTSLELGRCLQVRCKRKTVSRTSTNGR